MLKNSGNQNIKKIYNTRSKYKANTQNNCEMITKEKGNETNDKDIESATMVAKLLIPWKKHWLKRISIVQMHWNGEKLSSKNMIYL